MDNILSVIEDAPQEVAMRIAGQVKARRLEMNLTQEGLVRVMSRRHEELGDLNQAFLTQLQRRKNGLTVL